MGSTGREAIRALPRFHVLPEQITGGRVNLDADQAHKANHVLRLRVGDPLAVMDGSGDCFVCRVVWIERGNLSAEVLERHTLDTEPASRIHICQAIAKGDKLEAVVRSCTEVGASGFTLFESERCVARWPEARVVNRLERLRAIARDSAEVSLRARTPEVGWASDLASAPPADVPAVLLYEGSNIPLLAEVAGSCDAVAFVVGPEGGFSDAEVSLARERGWEIASLGPRVLRTEHAAFAAISGLLALRERAGR
ncbi:MAG: ribosomal RNA small subunit methyltransferase E [Fimbriimonadales bacterium]